MPENTPPEKKGGQAIGRIIPKKVPASEIINASPVLGEKPAAPQEEKKPEFENPRHIVREGMISVLIFCAICVVGAYVFNITTAIVAPGKIKLESERKIVQHLEGGIVDKILVRDGEEVHEGQPLLILKSVSVDANTNILRKRSFDLGARRVRLAAEKDLLDRIDWPEELTEMAKQLDSLQVLANEEKVFATRCKSMHTQQALLKSQLAQLEAQVGGMKDQLKAEGAILATLRDEVGAKRRLFNEHYLEKSHILQLERQVATHQGNQGNLREAIAQARQKKAELELRLKGLEVGFVENATKELAQTETALAQAKEQARPLTDAMDRLQITAPVAGKVVNIQVHSLGGVVASGQTLMEIVPQDSPLIVETHLPVDKIADVYVGQPAMVQLDAFNTNTTPHLPGKVTYVSADRLEERTPFGMEPYYLCYVEIDHEALAQNGLYILPGMPASVFLTQNPRLFAHYMLEPVIKAWDRALRD